LAAPRRKVSLADSNAGRLDARGRGGEAFLRGAASALSLARRQADLFFRGLNAGNGAFIAALGGAFPVFGMSGVLSAGAKGVCESVMEIPEFGGVGL